VVSKNFAFSLVEAFPLSFNGISSYATPSQAVPAINKSFFAIKSFYLLYINLKYV
jgi:hypothetical protein